MTWTTERIELLKTHFDAGLSCEQIARKIGVTRNAVIGKLNRMGLTRLKSGLSTRRELSTPSNGPRTARVPRAPRPKLLTAAAPCIAEHEQAWTDQQQVVVASDRNCSLLDLTEFKCRWPIGEPGSESFYFCGNERADGLSYCAAHARVAYRRKAA